SSDLNDHLAHSLAGTHDIGWIDRLVRRNQDKSFYTVLVSEFCSIVGSEYIIFDCLIRACLHQRYMFVCCRMENELWMIRGEYLFQTSGIPHRSDQCDQI